MDALVDLILNGSTELDAPAIVRLIVVVMALELFSVACGVCVNDNSNIVCCHVHFIVLLRDRSFGCLPSS